ncbi:hypothetical protein ACSBR2_013166 [Camellia fascicularis]
MAATIPIFDGENYEFWNVKMETLFLSMDLWDTVENGYDDETDKEKQKKNAAALSLIQRGVSDWIFKTIVKAKKAKEAWDFLQEKFQTEERRTRFSRNRLQRLRRLRVPPNISKSKDNHLIVATLIATVTFTAGITMPGGYINDNKDRNQGMAILTRKAAFVAFVITDTIALTLSVFAVLTYFYAMVDNPTVLKKQLTLAFCQTAYALIAMLLAFITGTYAVLAPSRLSISVCVIPSILLFIYLYYQCYYLPRAHTEDIRV